MESTALVSRDTSSSCYAMTGSLSPFDSLTYIPCNTTAVALGQHSACCAPGDKCLTNGLCQYGQIKPNVNEYWSVACTDKTWKDPACPTFCQQIPLEKGHETHLVFQCPGDGEWCCATGHFEDFPGRGTQNTTCCSIKDLAFTDEAAIVYTTAEVHLEVLTSIAEGTSTSSSEFSTARVTAVATASTTSIASPVSTSMAMISPTSAIGDLASSTASPTSQSSKDNSLGIAVGAGVGIPLVALLGVSLAFILYRQKRRRNTEMHRLEEEETRENNPHAYYMEAGGGEIMSELQGTRDVVEKDSYGWEMHDLKR